jgi:hypothetical protein
MVRKSLWTTVVDDDCYDDDELHLGGKDSYMACTHGDNLHSKCTLIYLARYSRFSTTSCVRL